MGQTACVYWSRSRMPDQQYEKGRIQNVSVHMHRSRCSLKEMEAIHLY